MKIYFEERGSFDLNCNSNREPYIGMPIYLDDGDCNDVLEDLMGCNPGEGSCMAGRNFSDWPLAMAYVPMQPWEETYALKKALDAGTLFPSLDLPFIGGMRP